MMSVAGATKTERQALGRPATSPWTTLRDEKQILTDGWNYEKVVVGSNLRVEIQIKSGHLHWAKKIQNMKEIDIQNPFNEYWASGEHELTVLGRSSSQTSSLISDKEA